jgi:cytochrome c-type biogenesis protein CcmF
LHLGTVLIAISLATALLFLVLLFVYRFTGVRMWRRFARFAMVGSFTSLSASLALLFYSFLVSDFSIHQVWEYSGRDLDWWLKLSGAWAGRSGSIMFWTWLIMVSLFVEELRRKLGRGSEKAVAPPAKKGLGVHDWTLLIAMVPAAVFMLVLLSDSPFADLHPTDSFPDPLAAYPDGLGLNPLLRTLWMAIHPPLLFVGYALITIPFAAAIGHALTKDKAWSDISLKWSRAAWIFLTLGLGVGAVWAYVVLGWGGYWGWDPVEVSSLVPWVTLTAFLHAQLKNRRTGEYKVLAPLLGLSTFVLVVFATFVTRGGAWVSVHAWESGDVTTYSYLGLMLGSLVLGGIAIFRSMPGSEAEDETPSRTRDPAMYATVILLGVIALILFIGVLVNQGAITPSYYETRLVPLSILLVLALGICLTLRVFKKMEWYYAVGWMLLAGVIGAVILPRALSGLRDSVFYDLGPLSISRMSIAGFVIPSLLFALAGSFYKILKHIKGGPRAILHGIGPHLAHLGVVFILIGYVATNTFNNETTLTLAPDSSVEFQGYTFQLENVSQRTEGAKTIWDYTIAISAGGQDVGTAHPLFIRYTDVNRTTAEVSIISRLTEDVYIVPVQEITSGGTFHALQVRVKTNPLTVLLWSGLALAALGMGARFLARLDAPSTPGEGPKAISPAELDGMDKDRLRALCRELGEDDRGSEKALRRRLKKRLQKPVKGSGKLDRD